jgi:multiple sugar transport system substrate-binding protein
VATIKDIAKLAGVSHGTVSNVMNHRGNVSSKKIRLVEEAARQLGYNTNAQAQKLRQEYNRHVAFILPDIEQRTHRVFYTSLKAMLEGCQYDTSLYLTNNTPESEHSCIRTALSNRPEYIVTFTCSDTAKEYAGVNAKVIFINHPLLKPRKNQISFFFDFEKAAVAFMEKIRQKKSRTVGFFFDSISVPAHRSFYQSLDKMLGKKKIDTFPFFYDPRQIYHGAIAVLEHIPPVDLVISNNPFYMEKLKQVQELLGCALPDIMTFGMSETMFPPLYPCYEFDYREVARHVFSVIREGKKHFGQAIAVEAKGFVDDLVRGVSHKGNADRRRRSICSP